MRIFIYYLMCSAFFLNLDASLPSRSSYGNVNNQSLEDARKKYKKKKKKKRAKKQNLARVEIEPRLVMFGNDQA